MEYNRLAKWQDKLHICIRCGYCFEQCHIFKITGWETDTPRGKLIMLHGLLQGDVEPTDYLVEKVFECYMCKRCDATCSAKVLSVSAPLQPHASHIRNLQSIDFPSL